MLNSMRPSLFQSVTGIMNLWHTQGDLSDESLSP